MSFLKKILYSESYKKGIILSVFFNICSKGLLFVVNIAIAFYFGTNTETDIYFYLNATLLILVGYINNIDTAVLIPELMRLKHQEDEGSYKIFINFFLYLYLLIGAIGVCILFFFNTNLYALISNFSTATIASHRTMFLISSFNFLLLIVINYLVNILTSLKYFTLPMMISVVNSVMVLAAVIFGHQTLGTTGIIIGATLAQLVNVMLLIILMKVNLKWKFGLIPKTFSIRRKVWKDIAWIELGQLSALFTNYLPIYLLSSFGNGAITAMNFGKSIAEIPNSLLTSQYSYIIGIKFNELYHKAKLIELNETFIKSGKLLVLILIPISCFISFHAEGIIQILLQHGSFNKTDAATTARFLSIFGLAIPFFAIGSLITRLCFAAQKARFVFFYQILTNLVFIIAIYAATRVYNIYGYSYGYLFFNIFNVLIAYYVCRYLLPQLKYVAFVGYFFGIFIFYIVLSIGMYWIHKNNQGFLFMTVDFLVYLICFLYIARKWIMPYYHQYLTRKQRPLREEIRN
ncbi:MAG: lipid II flippase MurJ [Ferruginibacter sp.]